jgi:hypothetical protein
MRTCVRESVCVRVCQCLLFVGNKTLTTMGEDKWSKRKNCSSFTGFAFPSTHFQFSLIFFSCSSLSPYPPHHPPPPPLPLRRKYFFGPSHEHILYTTAIYTHSRWLMMSIFHLSVCANFCFSQQFTLDSPLDRTCENEIIIIVLRGACRLMYVYV